jgi:hypothetical protein
MTFAQLKISENARREAAIYRSPLYLHKECRKFKLLIRNATGFESRSNRIVTGEKWLSFPWRERLASDSSSLIRAAGNAVGVRGELCGGG